MSGSINKVIIVGNLGRDPEVGALQNGDRVVRLSIATSERWKDKSSGEPREKTEWHRIVIFNEPVGRIAEQYLQKGSTVYIEGQLQTRKWQDQNGVDKYTTEIVLGRFRGELAMIGSRNDNLSSNSVSDNLGQSNQNSSSAKEIDPPIGGAGDLDDEIPF